MDLADRSHVADLLFAAYRTKESLPPLTGTYPGLDLDDAYQIQLLQIRRRLAEGRTIRGHKVGLTSSAMQRQLNVDQPDYGHLTDDMFHLEHLPIPVSQFLQPRVEPEIAFVLKRRLAGPGVTATDAIGAVDFVLPSLELIDSRITDWKIGLLDTIADNASSAGVILGSSPTRLDAVDLRLVGCTFHVNGALAATGAGGAVMGSPITALVWLANTIGAMGGSLEAGHVVLPGSLTRAVPVSAGDVVTATFGGLGSVTATFA